MFMGNIAPMLGEVQELRASAPRKCHTMNNLECTYQGLSLLYDVLFGPDHPLCSAFQAFIQQYMAMKSTLENNFRAPGEIQMLVQQLQRHTQLQCVQYLNVAPQLGAAAAGEPDFNDAIRALNFRNWQSLPYIPRRYWQQQPPPPEQQRGDAQTPPAETPLAPKTPQGRGGIVQNLTRWGNCNQNFVIAAGPWGSSLAVRLHQGWKMSCWPCVYPTSSGEAATRSANERKPTGP